MPSDPVLFRIALDALDCRGAAGGPQDAIATEIEMRLGRPLTSQAIEDQLRFLLSQGYAATRRDEFQRAIWWITDAGKNRRLAP